MEIEIPNGIKLRINEEDKTSSVIESNKAEGDVFIPRYVEYNGQQYPVISIENFAFSGTKIKTLSFAEDSEVKYFGGSIFFGCHQIQKFQIPGNLNKISDAWALSLENFVDIEVSAKNNTFQKGRYLLGKSEKDNESFDLLYMSCLDEEEAIIPPQVKILKPYSFNNHKKIKKIIFPANSQLKSIESHSFSSTPLQKLVLPATVEKIDTSNFQLNNNLVEIQISPKNPFFSLVDNKYLVTKSKESESDFDTIVVACRDIETINIQPQIKFISSHAFENCMKLKTVNFTSNSSLKILESHAFFKSGIVNISLPDSLIKVGPQVFNKNCNIESIEFNSKHIEIGSFSFYGCPKLISISFPNAIKIDFDNYMFNNSNKAKIYVRHDAELTGDYIEKIKDRINYIDNFTLSPNEKMPEEQENNLKQFNDPHILMNHIRYLEKSLGEFESVLPFNPNYDNFKKSNENVTHTEENFFIGTDEESEKYDTIRMIGEGNTSVVYKLIDKKTMKPICKKVLKGEKATFKDVQNALKEFEILHSLNHQCICRAIAINTQEELEEGMTTISILIEFVDFKLKDFLASGLVSSTLKTRIIVEIVHAMRYIHSKDLIYRDLKIDNIMLNSIFQTKMIDFGLVKMNELLFGEELMNTYAMTKGVGDALFMSPEMLNDDDDYDNKTDVYSFGIVVYFIFVGNLPDQSIKDKINQKPIQLPKESRSISKVCIDMMSKCLSLNPNDRPSFIEILEFLRKNKFMLASDVDPEFISQRDEELELSETY